VVQFGLRIQRFMKKHNEKRIKMGLEALNMRVGIHTGPVAAGIVGVKKFQYDIWGDTVNTAARMENSGEVGKVNISETTYELVKDQFACTSRGEVEVKGKGLMKMYFAEKG
jgi:class 3 adenylate cyclase